MFAPRVAKPKPGDGVSGRSTPLPRRPNHSGAGDAAAWDFSKTPLRFPVQAKLEIGAVDDPLEHEADRLAEQVLRAPDTNVPRAQRHAVVRGEAWDWEHTAPSPETFRGRGEPLAAPARGFFEQRLGHDFSGVRVHHGPDAGASARSLGARAYTYGQDVVFGAGEYSAGSQRTTGLLAHELAHVVQQGAGRRLVQRSPLSDSVKAASAANPSVEALLARLSQDDVQKAQGDADVDAEIARILANRPDDLWVAQKIRQGRLGQSTGAHGAKVAGKAVSRPVEAYFFKGSTDRRALVIAGVHGTEQQGIEVARMLIDALKKQQPVLTTIVVPSMFPDTDSTGVREGATPTNRNMPPPSESLADAKAAGGGKAVDASKSGGKRTREILPENLMLIELMERFHPERIISIHGTWGPGSAGVFYDRRSLRPEEVKAARDWAIGNAYMRTPPDQQDAPGGQEQLHALEERLFQRRLAELSGNAEQTDHDLSLKAAKQIDADTSAVKGRGGRSMGRENESPATTAKHKDERLAHASISGNVGSEGDIDNATWSGGTPNGVSLGGYAPARGMSVFTVEPPVDAESSRYPDGKDRVSGKADKLSKADRITELKAYADAVRTVLLGS